MHASARREVERLRRAKHAGGFALIASGPEKRGSSGSLLDEQKNLCELTRVHPSGDDKMAAFWDGDRMDMILRRRS